MLVAAQVLKANQGTRFVQITSNDGWDMHQNIYAANTLPAKAKILDDGLSTLIADLKSAGLLDSTLIVMAGEFGRTVGPITAQGGRDHWPQQFAFFAGGGCQGRQDHRPHRRSRRRCGGLRLVGEAIRCTLKISRQQSTPRSASTGPPSATTIPSAAASSTCQKTGPFAFMPVHELWG
jgi:hypothetical protein